jgi:hypothetical protein
VGTGTLDSARRSLAELDRLLWTRTSASQVRQMLVEVHQSLYGFTAGAWQDGPPPETLKQDLVAAARVGRLVITRTPSKFVGLLPLEPGEVLGPDNSVRDDFIRVLLFDSVGKPIPSSLDPLAAKVDIRISGGPAYNGLSLAWPTCHPFRRGSRRSAPRSSTASPRGASPFLAKHPPRRSLSSIRRSSAAP